MSASIPPICRPSSCSMPNRSFSLMSPRYSATMSRSDPSCSTPRQQLPMTASPNNSASTPHSASFRTIYSPTVCSISLASIPSILWKYFSVSALKLSICLRSVSCVPSAFRILSPVPCASSGDTARSLRIFCIVSSIRPINSAAVFCIVSIDFFSSVISLPDDHPAT